MSLTWALVTFAIVIVIVLFSIIRLKVHPFIALLAGAILIGLFNNLPLLGIASGVAAGFGGTLTGIGIVIVLGVILGELLHESGCAREIATLILRITGRKNAVLAMNMTGMVVSIPVFFDAAFVLLINLVKSISKKGKISFISLTTALAVGLIVTHCMVIPTPGPFAVAENMQINIGMFFIYSMLVAIPAALAGGVLYGKYLEKNEKYATNYAQAFDDEEEPEEVVDGDKPSGVLGIWLILLPIIMILAGTIGGQLVEKGSSLYNFLMFTGDKNIALFVGTIVAFISLKKYLKRSFNEIINTATSQAGVILIITGAGGSFGRLINMTSIGTELKVVLAQFAHSSSVGALLIISGFLISQVLRSAQGSSTVALVTTSAIMGPTVMEVAGASPILVAIAICAGGIGGSLPNDSGFWVVNRFARFSIAETFRTWTVGGSIAGATALAVLLILNFASGVLPGL